MYFSFLFLWYYQDTSHRYVKLTVYNIRIMWTNVHNKEDRITVSVTKRKLLLFLIINNRQLACTGRLVELKNGLYYHQNIANGTTNFQ